MDRLKESINLGNLRTPWGFADAVTRYSRGLNFYNTPGHGGFKVAPKRNEFIPAELRNANGWYEEDCEWAIVAHTFPTDFTQEELMKAKDTLINWYPDFWEKLTQTVLQPGQSFVKDKKEFEKANLNNYVVDSAWGDWKQGVPKGMAGVIATRAADKDRRWFLVDANEYNSTSTLGRFVIDLTRHQEIAPLP